MKPDDELPPIGDDAIIGKAFRGSVIVLAAVVGIIGLLVWWFREVPPAASTLTVSDVVSLPNATLPSTPEILFTDVTVDAGIDFVHQNGARGDRLLPEAMGGGNAIFDYDNDGDPDILLVDSRSWPGAQAGKLPSASLKLYANDGHGHFDDVTKQTGLSVTAYGMGVAAADYDGDGQRDIFITALGENILLRNIGGQFVDVTYDAGVAGGNTEWSTAATFFDYNGDGYLDLFVGNYVTWSRAIDLAVNYRLTGIGRAYGPPTGFAGSQSYLYRNNGKGGFVDMSDETGIRVLNTSTGAAVGKVLGALAIDIDADHDLDLIVANDTVGNFVFRNDSGTHFKEVGAETGLAFNRDGQATGAMGIDAAWYRNDNDLAVAIGNFANEMTSLYVAPTGEFPFIDQAMVDGLGSATRLPLTFGLLFVDADLDGWVDLVQVNGHVEPDIARVQSAQKYLQRPQLFWNCGRLCDQSFIEVPARGLADLSTPLVARGASYADFDGDGDLDILITQAGSSARIYRNEQTTNHHWLRVRLQNQLPNRDALGALVEITTTHGVQRRQVMPTRGYLSQVELPLTFGLGEQTTIDSVVVHWPDGERQIFESVAVDQMVLLNRDGRVLRIPSAKRSGPEGRQ